MYILSALKIKRKILESLQNLDCHETHLAENIFGLNCEDWDNMALS